MSIDKYKFPCGCEFEVVDSNIKDCDGLPSIFIDYYNLPDCPATWQLIQSGHTKGIFQLETNLGRKWAKELSPSNIDEISALVALMRPGVLKAMIDGKSMTQHYCDRKNAKVEVEYFHKALEPILKDTYGILIFQEESMRIATDIAGFNLQEADGLRKCITSDTMFVSKQRGWISIQELIKTGYDKDLFLVMDELGNQQWKHITKIWSTGKHDVNKVETQSGMYVKATKYHQFLTNHGWTSRSRLKNNDYIVCAKSVQYDGSDIISPELAFIIAGIITEGYFVEENGATFVNHDQKMMRWFTSRHEKCFGFGKTNNDPYIFTIKKHVKDRIAKYLKFGKSVDKEIPVEMMRMTKTSTQDFLSFMLGCDGGCCEQAGQFEYCSKSKKLINQIQLLLLRFNIRSTINIKNDKDYGIFYRLYINDKTSQKLLYDQLSCWWPEGKRDVLGRIIDSKNDKNYTTDVIPTNIVQQLLDQYPFVGNYESGSVYSKPISRERFRRLVDKSADIYWQQLANGNQQYQKIKNLKEKTRQQITYDFTVEGDDTPYIIANGLVIHNSLGKKKADEMAKIKPQFINGCISKGIVTKEEAEQIFEWIEKGQRYLFNSSHSYSYGTMGYWAAYAKAHFPLHFYTSWLSYANEKMDPQEEMQLLISDARFFDINIYPPSLKKLFLGDIGNFALDKDAVYFGIGNIKRIGESLVNKVITSVELVEKQIGRTIDEWTWHDFLIHFSDTVTQTVVNGVINAGATDYIEGSRVWKVHQYNTWLSLTQKERDWIKENGPHQSLETAMTNLVTYKTRLSKPRQAKIVELITKLNNCPYSLKDTAQYIADHEKDLLGIPLTCNKLDVCENVEADTTCKEFLQGKKGKMAIAVEIVDVREYIIKNGKHKNKIMLYLNVEDSTGAIDSVVVFPTALEGNEPLLIRGSTLLLEGQRDYRNQDSFVVEKVKSI